jgi:hypothetical protein
MSAVYKQMLAKHNGNEIEAQIECMLPLCDNDYEKAKSVVLKQNKVKTPRGKKSRSAPRRVKKEKYDMFDDLSIYVPAHYNKFFPVLTDIKIRGAIFKKDFATASALVSVGRIHKNTKTKTSVDTSATPFTEGKYVATVYTPGKIYDVEFEVVKRTKVQATFKYGDSTIRRKIYNDSVLLPIVSGGFQEVFWKNCYSIN